MINIDAEEEVVLTKQKAVNEDDTINYEVLANQFDALDFKDLRSKEQVDVYEIVQLIDIMIKENYSGVLN